MERRAALVKLLDTLPEIGAGETAEEELRATLRYIVIPSLEQGDAQVQIAEDYGRCPNCSEPNSSTRSPYCSEHCRLMSAFIRQFRASLKEGSLYQAERQVGMGQALWNLQGGGFPRRQQMVTEKERLKVIAKAEGLCWKCGSPATGVDHFGSACNRTSNLRAVCDACNRGKGFGVAEYELGETVRSIHREVALRIGSVKPIRVCDDADQWDWRAFLRERKKAL